jgi:hypothetical protein
MGTGEKKDELKILRSRLPRLSPDERDVIPAHKTNTLPVITASGSYKGSKPSVNATISVGVTASGSYKGSHASVNGWATVLSPDALAQMRELEASESDLDVQDRIGQVQAISADLMRHLRGSTDDIAALPWDVFEQFVAECLASRGFEDVRLVGRNARTAADILAIQHIESTDVRLRYFVEVKRWKDQVGVEVIDRVIGAMTSEGDEWGWHLAMIVSPAGFKSFRKYSRESLKSKRIELRDKSDIIGWLRDYRPSDKGLWLPQPFDIGHITAP